MRVVAGPEKKTRVMGEKERLITAYHEMGHAIVGHYLEHSDPVHKVSIISRGQALGYTISLPTEDKFLTTRAELTDTMAMTLGGRAAEEIVFGEITTGASNDLEKVTATAKQMVMRFGMSEKLGPRVFGHDHGQPFLGREFSAEPDYSDEIAREIDDEIRRIVEGAHQQAKDILAEHREALTQISELLLKRETIEREEFEALLAGKAAEEVFGPDDVAQPTARPSARSCPRPPTAPAATSRARCRAPASPAARPRRAASRCPRSPTWPSARRGQTPSCRGGVARTVAARLPAPRSAGLHEQRGAARWESSVAEKRHALPPPHPSRERRRAAAVGRPPPPTVQLEEAQHLMRSFDYIVPVDTRSAQRSRGAHYSTPVVRELRAHPPGLAAPPGDLQHPGPRPAPSPRARRGSTRLSPANGSARAAAATRA